MNGKGDTPRYVGLCKGPFDGLTSEQIASVVKDYAPPATTVCLCCGKTGWYHTAPEDLCHPCQGEHHKPCRPEVVP